MALVEYPFVCHLLMFAFRYRQRATNIDPAVREERLRYFSAPIRASWQDEQFKHSVATFPGFCEMFGLDRVWRYLETRGVSQISDWTTVPLDEEGQKLRDEINLTFSVCWALSFFIIV